MVVFENLVLHLLSPAKNHKPHVKLLMQKIYVSLRFRLVPRKEINETYISIDMTIIHFENQSTLT